MESQVLVIDFMDEAVDIEQPGVRDYIGSARIPLREAYIKGSMTGKFALLDDERDQNGEV